MDEEKSEEKRTDDTYLIPGAIIVAGVLVAGAVIYTSGGGVIKSRPEGSASAGSAADSSAAGSLSRESLIDDDPSLGNPDAPVVVVEFSDFQCPFCARFFRDVLPQLKEKYVKAGKVLFVYRDFPLSSIHNMAQKAAEAAQCAYEQGKFWQYHDLIFERQSDLSVESLRLWAVELGLNTGQFNACLDSGKYADEVAKDLKDVTVWGGRGTPTTFINGRLISGALPWDSFEAIIEEELNKLNK